MKITDLLKDRRVNDSKKVENERNSDSARAPGRAEDSSDSDKVTISTLGRKYSQVAELLAENDEEQRLRVEDLKRQIEEGTYDVSSEKVAQALVSFARDNSDR